MEMILTAGQKHPGLLRASVATFKIHWQNSGRCMSPAAQLCHRVTVNYSHFSHGRSTSTLALTRLGCHGNQASNNALPSLSRAVHKNVLSGVPAVQLRLHRNCLVIQHARWPLDNMFVSLAWLRDHCRCNTCYNHTTSQRQADIRYLKLDDQPSRFELDESNENIHIVWSDGHESRYNLQWIWQNSVTSAPYRRQQQEKLWTRNLWDGRVSGAEGLKAVDYTSMMETEEGLRQHMKNFLTDGIAAVTKVEATLEATERVIQRVGAVQQTHFGGMWKFAVGIGDFADSAYSNVALEPHTDTTYFTEPSGGQVFHCISESSVGGETLLVDGFCALHKLYSTDPDAYHVLSTVPCAGEYIDNAQGGIHTVGSGSVITHRLGSDPVPENLRMLRFNPYDRAPLRAALPETADAFYRAYQKLTHLLHGDRYRRMIKLTPGTVLFIDNWRVLHGRAAFSGPRVLCGAYMRRSDLMSRARVLGLLV